MGFLRALIIQTADLDLQGTHLAEFHYLLNLPSPYTSYNTDLHLIEEAVE